MSNNPELQNLFGEAGKYGFLALLYTMGVVYSSIVSSQIEDYFEDNRELSRLRQVEKGIRMTQDAWGYQLPEKK